MDGQTLFTGNTVVITGSAGGLGLEMGRRFVESGAEVVLTDVNAVTKIKEPSTSHSVHGNKSSDSRQYFLPDTVYIYQHIALGGDIDTI